jgi:glycosyltransferase involved in cell wall biosynthesis
MPVPLAIVSVTNDLTTDQRVDRTCHTLVNLGYNVLLVGRRRRKSLPLAPRVYKTYRMRLLFDRGSLFYAEYNIRLLIFLIFRSRALLVSNDLDTLPANYCAWRLARIFGYRLQLLHDCHEYFRGVPELVGRKRVTAAWKWIEDRIFPSLGQVMAVNDSIARLYSEEYGKKIRIVRNVPLTRIPQEPRSKASMGIDDDAHVILYQGAVNIDRGLEEAILAMKHTRSSAVLVIAGTGDIHQRLISLTEKEGVSDKVVFLGQVPFEQLYAVTLSADLGLSIEKDVSINYHYALPNKFMDYIQAGVPVLVSPFPEMKAIVDHYCIGEYIESHDPQNLASQFDSMLGDRDKLAFYSKNMKAAAEDLCWEKEEHVIAELLNQHK